MSAPLVTLIVAVADSGVIGRDNTLPWHLPADLQALQAPDHGQTHPDGPQDLRVHRQAAARAREHRGDARY